MSDSEAKKKTQKKATISEQDVSFILHRYSATTIIALLQEIAQFTAVKMDWKELVKKTSTGITTPREYQMLWRSLAYRTELEDNIEDEVQPLDDDSDLESELEAFPPVGSEAAAEAAACAKLLLASGSQNSSDPPNRSTVEAPLTINIPNSRASGAPSDDPKSAYPNGMNIIIPVSVKKQSLPSVTSKEGPEEKGATGYPRKKRNPWTDEEDKELIAAVQKLGPGNWSNILKGDFKGERTASQLSQRWSIIKKRQANLMSCRTGNKANSQLSEQQLANRAVSHALNMHMGDSILAARTVGATHSSIPSSSEASLVSNTVGANSLPQAPQQTDTSVQKGLPSTTIKPRVIFRKGSSIPVTSSPSPNPMVQATAVAVGARIATPSTAASLMRAAQSKGALHIKPGGSSITKTAAPGSTQPLATNLSAPHSNVHYIHTGLSPPSVSAAYSDSRPSISQTGGSSVEPPVLTSFTLPLTTMITSKITAQPIIASPSVTASGTKESKSTDAISTVVVKEENVPAEEMEVDVSGNVPKESAHSKVGGPYSEILNEIQRTAAGNAMDSQNMEVDENSI